jgi:hypothetical protein
VASGGTHGIFLSAGAVSARTAAYEPGLGKGGSYPPPGVMSNAVRAEIGGECARRALRHRAPRSLRRCARTSVGNGVHLRPRAWKRAAWRRRPHLELSPGDAEARVESAQRGGRILVLPCDGRVSTMKPSSVKHAVARPPAPAPHLRVVLPPQGRGHPRRLGAVRPQVVRRAEPWGAARTVDDGRPHRVEVRP